MQFISKADANAWLAGAGCIDAHGEIALPGATGTATFTVLPDSGKKTALSRVLASWFRDTHESLLSIDEYGVWPSCEDHGLFVGYRASLGSSAPVYERPAQIFTGADSDAVASLIALVLYFCWGAVMVSRDRELLVRISHDEKITVGPGIGARPLDWYCSQLASVLGDGARDPDQRDQGPKDSDRE